MKKIVSILGILIFSLVLAACSTTTKEKTAESKTQKISYLGKEYEVPTKAKNVIAASLEAMEDAVVLGVKPVGVVSTEGKEMPTYLDKELSGATVVGPKHEPNTETMLSLEPDVILGSAKWDAKQMASYNKIAPTLPYTHISTNWKENITTFGKIVGKEKVAQKAIEEYEMKLAEVQEKIASSKVKDKKVVVIRVRSGLSIYPPNMYLNPTLYMDFGLKQPKELNDLEFQSDLTYETLAKWNPDIIFLQFAKEENVDTPDILNEVLENKVFKSTKAAKSNNVFLNALDPLAQGGTVWSKQQFIKAFEEKVLK